VNPGTGEQPSTVFVLPIAEAATLIIFRHLSLAEAARHYPFVF